MPSSGTCQFLSQVLRSPSTRSFFLFPFLHTLKGRVQPLPMSCFRGLLSMSLIFTPGAIHSMQLIGSGSGIQARELQQPPRCVHAKLLQSRPTLCDPMDCSLPGFSVHGVLQARILEWIAMLSSMGSS